MERAVVYKVLSESLRELEGLGFEELEGMLGDPPFKKTVRAGVQTVEIETSVQRESPAALRIVGLGLGPNTHRLERIEESVLVSRGAV